VELSAISLATLISIRFSTLRWYLDAITQKRKSPS
jgi:hypothetical protein